MTLNDNFWILEIAIIIFISKIQKYSHYPSHHFGVRQEDRNITWLCHSMPAACLVLAMKILFQHNSFLSSKNAITIIFAQPRTLTWSQGSKVQLPQSSVSVSITARSSYRMKYFITVSSKHIFNISVKCCPATVSTQLRFQSKYQ